MLKRVLRFEAATRPADDERFERRLERFGFCGVATDMRRALGVPDPAEPQDMHDDAFFATAEQHGESRHDAR